MDVVGTTGRSERRPTELTISCEACALQGTAACNGCLVTFVLDREPGDAVILDADEARALRVLHRAGLLPPSRFEAAAS